jgi:hypothetical protein
MIVRIYGGFRGFWRFGHEKQNQTKPISGKVKSKKAKGKMITG